MAQLSLALGYTVVVWAAAWTVGSALAGTRLKWGPWPLALSLNSALGLAVLSFVLFACVQLHWTSGKNLLLFFILVCGSALLRLKELASAIRRGAPRALCATPREKWMIAALAVYGIWILWGALLPASDRDELLYHLEVPKRILEAGGAVFFPDNLYAYYPAFGEMLFLLGFAVAGEMGAKLLHVLAGVLLTLSLYGFSRRYLSKEYSFLALAVFLTVPSVMVILPLAYVDLFYALYAFLSLMALTEFLASGLTRWIVVAGCLAGCAAATKYTGLQLVLLLSLILLVAHWIRWRLERPVEETEARLKVSSRWDSRGWPLSVLFFAVAAFSCVMPYLLRNMWVTGWPLYPYPFGSWSLAAGMNWDLERGRLLQQLLASYGTPLGHETIWHTLLSPILVFVTARFNSHDFYEGVIGPVFLLTPLVLMRAPKPWPVKPLIGFALLFLYAWALATKQARFLLPLLPVLSFLLAYGLSHHRSKMLHALVIFLVLGGVAVGVRETWLRKPLAYWLGKEPRELYLARQIESYPIYRAANRMLGPRDRLYLINMKNYGYLLDRPWRADFVFERYTLDQWMEKASSPEDVLSFFRERQITHLLIDERFVASPEWGMEPARLDLFGKFLAKHAKPLARYQQYAIQELT